MALTKITYKNNETVITAANMNEIQDELIRVANGFDNGDFQGEPGKDGVGIASIQQTTTSNADGGNNVFTVTLTNGTTATFTVKNGSKGSTGADGEDGKDGVTPNFSIGTVTTLSAGSGATATITGTAESPVLNLGIPKGKDGTNGTGGGGSSEPDLVINLNMASGKYDFTEISADDCSYTGELQTVKAKILNGENVNIVVKHGYHYGTTEYTGTVVPTQFGVADYGDQSVTYVEFILACCPGLTDTARVFFAVEIDDAGVISLQKSGNIL